MKKIIRISLLIAVIIILSAVIFKNHIFNKKIVTEQIPAQKQIIKAEIEQGKQILKVKDKNKKKTRFKTNDEIKQEYGKIETVHLWNGRVYTGAVINTDKLYSIVTVNGVIKIPMKDVKLREIIR